MTREDVYKIIDGERDYQDVTWPGGGHRTGVDITLLHYYMHEADVALTRNSGDIPALHVIRKIAAIAVRCLEEHGAPPRIAE